MLTVKDLLSTTKRLENSLTHSISVIQMILNY